MMLQHEHNTYLTGVCLLYLLLSCISAGAEEFQHPVRVRGMIATVQLGGDINVSRTFDQGQITVRLLLFPDTPYQTIRQQEATIQGPGPVTRPDKIVNEDGNRFAIFHLTRPGSYEYQLTATIKTDRHPSNSARRTETLSAKTRTRFTSSTRNVQAGDQQIKHRSGQLLTSSRFLKNLHNVTKWVHDNVQYDRRFYPQTISAAEVMRKRRGVCDEFSALAGALFRSGDIPVRFVSGVVFSGSSWGNHAWMEAFHPDVGWVPVDPTYEEAIVLDGTHIRRGHFDDPEGNSLNVRVQARSSNVSNIRLNQHEPKIDVRKTHTFSNLIHVDARNVTFPAQRWVSLQVLIDNQVSNTIIVPVLFRRIRDMKIKNRTTSLLINGEESHPVSWDLRLDRQLPERARLRGSYELITMDEQVQRSFEVLPGQFADASTGLVHEGGPPSSQREQTASAVQERDRNISPEQDQSAAAETRGPRAAPESWIPGWVPASWNLEQFSPVQIMYAFLGALAFMLALVYLIRD